MDHNCILPYSLRHCWLCGTSIWFASILIQTFSKNDRVARGCLHMVFVECFDQSCHDQRRKVCQMSGSSCIVTLESTTWRCKSLPHNTLLKILSMQTHCPLNDNKSVSKTPLQSGTEKPQHGPEKVSLTTSFKTLASRCDCVFGFLTERALQTWMEVLLNSICIIHFFRLRNSGVWRDIFWRHFRTRSVMGRLWDDHFRDLGYPPKFCKGQDAGFDSGSSS